MIRNIFSLLVIVLLLSPMATRAQAIPSPKEHFGFNIGDNYKLANYTQTEAYFKKLAAAAPDRCKLVNIGLTEEGRPQYMMIVSSAENMKNLDHYKEISQKLAHAENLTDEQAHALAAEGKAVVWVDGGLHATEVVATQQLIEIIYQMLSRKDPETLHLLDGLILLFVHANPDGMELVSDWYMKDADTLKRKTNVPRLWQKYIGHDNNRDFFMMNMKESQNVSRQQYVEWMPQIIYNHHQAGPPGSVVAGPPYRDPFNYSFDPLLVTSLDAVGAAMNSRLNMEGKPGYTQRSGSAYSTWWNGGLRTTGYFHNMVGLLTEIIGGPTPMSIPVVPQRLIPNMATPYPVRPQKWYFRQSIDYSVSLNYAVFNYALHQKEDLLYGIYRMGRNSIEAGSRDNWMLSPKRADSISNAFKRDQRPRPGATNANATAGGGGPRGDSIPMKYYDEFLKNPKYRDARGYIIPSNQPDFPTAIKFLNALIRSGILVQKATADFSVAGNSYPAGSYIVKTDQAFRPHVIDMFEPQDHPNDFQYPGGPPIRPYDATGWTLAYEMGVKFDRMTDGFDGPFTRIPYGELQSPVAKPITSSSGGYLVSAHMNNAFTAVNDLLKSGIDVYRLPAGVTGKQETGTFFVPASGKSVLDKSAALGLEVTAMAKRPSGAIKISPMRIGIWDNYGGSIPSGWVRWLMEQYHFPASLIYAQEINAGDLKNKFDLILFVGGAIPALRGGRAEGIGGGGGERGADPRSAEIPAEFRPWLGRLSADSSVPQLKKFMEAGGTVVTIGSSTNLAYHLALPVRNALVEMVGDTERPLPGEKLYIPGSLLRMNIDSTQQAGWGMPAACDVYFDESPVFKVSPEAIAKGQVTPLAWFSTNKPLRSGWAWGQEYLQDGVAAFVAPVGSGKLYAFGPEIMFRGQTHGTFKLFFNTLYK